MNGVPSLKLRPKEAIAVFGRSLSGIGERLGAARPIAFNLKSRTPSGAVNGVVKQSERRGGPDGGGVLRSGASEGAPACPQAGCQPEAERPRAVAGYRYKVEQTPRVGRFSHQAATLPRRRKGASPRSNTPPTSCPPRRSRPTTERAEPASRPAPSPLLVTLPGAGPRSGP